MSYAGQVVVLLVVLALAGAGGLEVARADATAKPIALTITYWPDEELATAFTRRTLRCNPLGGTLANRKTACRRLAQLTPAAFAPIPPDSICTLVYGGPGKAVVKGTMGTLRIWASFRRRNGCEIDRWQRFSPWLLPAAGVIRS